MLNTASVYIISPDAISIMAILGKSPLFNVTGISIGREGIGNALSGTALDLMILDGAVEGIDSLSLLKWMRWNLVAPPKVLYLSRGSEEWHKIAVDAGADGALPWPSDEAALLEHAKLIAEIPYSQLSETWQEARMRVAEEMLDRLLVPSELKGREYMKAAIAYGACSPWLIQSFTHRLYPWLAQRFNSSPKAVERAIRTAIENTWLKGNLEGIQDYFGFSVDAERGKPTNAEFLAMLAAHVYRNMTRIINERIKKNKEKGNRLEQPE